MKGLPRPRASLWALSSEVAGFCDAENILFYNIGAAAFSGLGLQSIIFERSFDASADLTHAMAYSTNERPTLWWHAEQTVEVDVPLLMTSRGSPDLRRESVWLQIEHSGVTAGAYPLRTGYGLSLTLEGPNTIRFALMPSLKMVFDGAVFRPPQLHWCAP